MNVLLALFGGYGGNFGRVWSFRRQANSAEVIFSTVDTVGIPLVLMRHFGLIQRPIAYVSVGLPERLVQLTNHLMRSLYRRAFGKIERIICYGFEEAELLRAWLNADGDAVQFVRFGVDTEWFRPIAGSQPTTDVVSIGRDSQRDFSLLIDFSRRHPEVSVRIVTNVEHRRKFARVPANVEVLTEVPFSGVRDYLADARIVALPVRPNSYSGATTTLCQAMAMGKPVVISAVGAIARGYELKDAVNCRLVPPRDPQALEDAIMSLLSAPARTQTMSAGARETAVEYYSWDRYVQSLVRAFSEAVEVAGARARRKGRWNEN